MASLKMTTFVKLIFSRYQERACLMFRTGIIEHFERDCTFGWPDVDILKESYLTVARKWGLFSGTYLTKNAPPVAR